MKNEDFLKYIKDNFDGLKRFEVNTDFYMSTDSTTSKTYLVLEKGDFYDSLGDTKFYRYAPSYVLAQKLAKDLDKPLVALEGGYGTDYVNNINITDRDDIKMMKPSDSWLDYETSYFPYAGLIIYEYHKGDGTLSLVEKPIISEEERYRAIETPLADTIDYRLKALKKLLKDKDRAKKEQDLIEDISGKIKKLSKVQRAKILAMLIK